MNNQTAYAHRFARRVPPGERATFGSGGRAPLNFVFGVPDPTLFPAEAIAAATARVMSNPADATGALQYGKIQGQPPMLQMLADKLRRDEDLAVEPDNFVITNGSSGAIALIGRIFVDPGDVVLVEAPSFMGAMTIFRHLEADLRAVPTGPDGIDIAKTSALLESLSARGRSPRLLYTMPTLHNPTGSTMPAQSRAELVQLAERYDLTILEDDAYHDLHYDTASGALPPSLYSFDRQGMVVRTGTFSKILAPGVRLGWAIAHPDVVKKLLLLKDEGGTTPLAQHIAVEFARDGGLDAYIAGLVSAYRAKRDAMLSALEAYFPPEATWSHPAGGFFVWVTLPDSVDPAELATAAHSEGVDYMPGEACFVEPPFTPGTYMRLSFSTMPVDAIEEGIKRLGRVVRAAVS